MLNTFDRDDEFLKEQDIIVPQEESLNFFFPPLPDTLQQQNNESLEDQ